MSYDPDEGFSGPKCHINPRLFHELEYPMVPTEGPKKKVLVIGGGIGGMEAAYTAAVRGHDVTIWERSKELGQPSAVGLRPAHQAGSCQVAGISEHSAEKHRSRWSLNGRPPWRRSVTLRRTL